MIKHRSSQIGKWNVQSRSNENVNEMNTNVNMQLQNTLGSANSTLLAAQTNLNAVSSSILLSLENVANLTSNLHAQVQGNGRILTELSDLVVHTDEMIQGLKRNWLLRSSFRQGSNPPPQSIVKPRIGENTGK